MDGLEFEGRVSHLGVLPDWVRVSVIVMETSERKDTQGGDRRISMSVQHGNYVRKHQRGALC